MVYCEKEYIAEIIRKARKQKGLKQAQLAEKVGISEKHLSKIETGKNYPALDNFFKIIEVLDLSFKNFGLEATEELPVQKLKLQRIINTSSDEQINAYLDIIECMQKYI